MAAHSTKVKKADDPYFENMYGEAWDVTCSCGWQERRSTEERALESGDAHVAEQNAEADTSTVATKKAAPARKLRSRSRGRTKTPAAAPAAPAADESTGDEQNAGGSGDTAEE